MTSHDVIIKNEIIQAVLPYPEFCRGGYAGL